MMTTVQRRHEAAHADRHYADDDARWQAVQARDEAADGHFWLSVATTGVYCYPSCAARHPLRRNVAFHDSRDAAERAGFRACKRCRPDLPPRRVRHAEAIARACRMIEERDEAPSLKDLAHAAGLSPHYFQRRFKAIVGVSPKQYASAFRAQRVRRALGNGASVTDVIYDAGFNSSARFYESSRELLGMKPSTFAKGGKGEIIRWDVAESWLGPVLVAATGRGICAVLFGESTEELQRSLAARFPRASYERAEPGSEFSGWLARTLALIEAPDQAIELPLDVRGTAFQRQVWDALRRIPAGETTTYQTVAKGIGRPKAVRAVASAIAANPVAIAIPCHRVVASNGTLAGYRWGLERKAALLRKEAQK